MTNKISRREFLGLIGLAGAAFFGTSCMKNEDNFVPPSSDSILQDYTNNYEVNAFNSGRNITYDVRASGESNGNYLQNIFLEITPENSDSIDNQDIVNLVWDILEKEQGNIKDNLKGQNYIDFHHYSECVREEIDFKVQRYLDNNELTTNQYRITGISIDLTPANFNSTKDPADSIFVNADVTAKVLYANNQTESYTFLLDGH